MKKIPTLFERVFQGHNIVEVLPNVIPGMEWVLAGEGVATTKVDGSCCALIDRIFYKRYDAKNGKPVPKDAIKCQEEADPITGHLPCWVLCGQGPEDKWFWEALVHSHVANALIHDGTTTYEAIGPHFCNNPHDLDQDILVKHGEDTLEVERTFEGIRDYLRDHEIEGIVFWKDGQPQCKIKRSDFGFPWSTKR